MYSVCIYTLLKLVCYYDLSVLSMSVMGFQKKVWTGVGGWCELYRSLFRIFGIVLTLQSSLATYFKVHVASMCTMRPSIQSDKFPKCVQLKQTVIVQTHLQPELFSYYLIFGCSLQRRKARGRRGKGRSRPSRKHRPSSMASPRKK